MKSKKSVKALQLLKELGIFLKYKALVFDNSLDRCFNMDLDNKSALLNKAHMKPAYCETKSIDF